MKTVPMALATGDARRRWLIWMMINLVGSSARGEGGGEPWPNKNAEGWGKWAFCLNTNLSEASNALKKLNCKMKIEKSSLA